MFGTGWSAVVIVSILEIILVVYSIALACNAKNKGLKITHIILAVFWGILVFLNIFIH